MAKKKPGIYDHLIAKLPRLIGKEPERQAKINAIKDAMRKEPGYSDDSAARANAYVSVRVEEVEHDAIGAEISLRRDATEQLMLDAFKKHSQTSAQIGAYGISTHDEPYAQIQDKEALRLWLIANGYQNRMTLTWASVNSISKERLKLGEPEPDGVVTHAVTKVKVSGLKGVAPEEE